MTKNIHVSAGEREYVGGTLTELEGKDITGATFTIALGLNGVDSPDSGWVTPSVSARKKRNERILKLLVDDSFDLGTFYCWGRAGDSPEVKAILLQGPIRIY